MIFLIIFVTNIWSAKVTSLAFGFIRKSKIKFANTEIKVYINARYLLLLNLKLSFILAKLIFLI